MSRKVLLVEPNYSNKYPPIGLMKLATYHRQIGDEVRYFKGDLKEFALNEVVVQCITKFYSIEKLVNWHDKHVIIKKYLIRKDKLSLEEIVNSSQNNKPLLKEWLKYYYSYYHEGTYKKYPQWDRVCITTLFTFHWDITIKCINDAKELVKDIKELWVGGVLATVLHKELKNETGISSHKGLLNKSGILDRNDIVIDELPLDYSILDEIDYKYPENNAYYGYMTRGCVRKCDFCVVWKLEPKFSGYIPIEEKIETTVQYFGEKRNLLLFDNNVLASKKFEKIIEEIKRLGFSKGAKFIEPNQLDIAISNLKDNYNIPAQIRRINSLLHQLLHKSKGKDKQWIYDLLKEYNALNTNIESKDELLNIYSVIKDYYEKYRNKSPKLRYVDFNQGLDARFVTESKIKLLSEIPINPIRIAFDSMEHFEDYDKAIRLAAKYGIKTISNYLLYNFQEPPEDLYERLKYNVEMCENLNVNIYSFPMKYLPIDTEKYYMNRDYIGRYWNRKFLRAIQAILNSTKGKIGKGKSFFNKAFGSTIEEYRKLLYMPEPYIIYRLHFEKTGLTGEWHDLLYNRLTAKEREIAMNLIEAHDFSTITQLTKVKKIQELLQHYKVTREDISRI